MRGLIVILGSVFIIFKIDHVGRGEVERQQSLTWQFAQGSLTQSNGFRDIFIKGKNYLTKIVNVFKLGIQ